MIKYIIGIDGGGTKTLGVLFDLDGKPLHRVKEGFSNFSVDEAIAIENISLTIEKLLSTVSVKPNEVYIQLGIAGATKMRDKGLDVLLENRFNQKVSLETDALVGLYSVKRENESVIMAIGGTGSAIMSREEGEINTIGGYGHLLGDEGSAYHLVISAFKNLIAEAEAQKPFGDLSKALLEHIHGESEQDVIPFIYSKNKSDIASISRITGPLARRGDAVTTELYKREGQLLAKQIVQAKKNFIKSDDLIIAPRGAFVLEAPFVMDSMMDYLKTHIKSFNIDLAPQEPVVGAFNLAKAKQNKE
ncbi:MAG: hypothetical protein CVV63_01215 [Tenericutes bacterium HGW-Tenericutes-8]|nr:MAG: hypothetical protein CVV63_01215 [Tenericutes bacterium HGW-Tenericutes-8]